MSAVSRTIGRYLVETLAANGIDTVFGIPGVHNLELYRGLEYSRLRHVLARHEQNAGFAADGFARATARPAAAFVISGPGATNIVTAVAQAYSDSVPLLVIASSPHSSTLGSQWGVLHELRDQRALLAQVTGFAGSARSAEDVRELLRQGFATLRAPRPRPAYLDVPLDVLAQPTELPVERFPTSAAVLRPDPQLLARAQQLLAGAQRPLLIAGGGARAAGAALLGLLDSLDTFLITTVAAKGVVAESHPGNLGASLPYAPVQALVASADVLVAAGTELSETDVFNTLRLPFAGRLIRIDVDAHKLNDHFAADLRIQADAAATLQALAEGSRARSGWRTTIGPATLLRRQIEQSFTGQALAQHSAVQALRAALPADGAVFSDMTQIAYLGNYAFRSERPGLWYHPSGYGTLGFALPAAIGAKIGQPARPIVALAGDFGCQFSLQELMSAVELDLTLPVIVWNNEALGQIRDDMQAAGIAPIGVVGRNPDFVALAGACGAAGVRVHDPAQLEQALRAALQRSGPTVLEAAAADFLHS
jgi:5-guanidino-2-oxopentanoate decarboxylase